MDISTSISTGILMKHDIEIDLSLDYHAHILPGCDHGSDGLETSLKQVAMAASAGVGTVCATPHFYPHKESVEAFLQRRAKTAELLLNNLTENATDSARRRGADMRWYGEAGRAFPPVL